MPVCTNCAYPAENVYTTYKTKSNIRLGVCSRCHQFMDPLIEHPDLIILLDLILLKPRVFLHLLFNRGSPPFDADKGVSIPLFERQELRGNQIKQALWRLGSLSVIAETTLRLLPTIISNTALRIHQVIKIGGIVMLEGLAQHFVTVSLALIALRIRGWYPFSTKVTGKKEDRRDGRQENFLPSLISLTLLYTSLLPLLLQLLLSIWYTPPPSIHEHLPSSQTTGSSFDGLPFQLPPEFLELENAINHIWARSDRIWVGTRLLGGMSAGFGLRVLLPTKPWETTAIVLSGWIGAALIAQLVNDFPLNQYVTS